MRAVILSLLVLAAPVLSGCLGDDGDGDIGPQRLNNSSANNLTLPQGRDGEFAAFKETNRTDDYGSHDHDYWSGRARVEVVNMEVELDPGYGSFGASKVVRLPPGGLIYEGTGKVEVLIENPRRHVCEDRFHYGGDWVCTDHAGGSAPDDQPVPAQDDPGLAEPLNVKFIHSASDLGDWIDAGEADWGVPLEIDIVAATWTDMPHSTGSLWQFLFEGPSDMDDTLEFDLVITVVKDDEPAVWPAHPVFYDEDTRVRKVMDAQGKVSNFGAPSEDTPTSPAKLISAGTRTILVFANITSVTGKPLEPTNWYLFFHNASFTDWNITATASDGYPRERTELVWKLPMPASGMDNPYATQSRWEFIVRGSHATPAGPSCYNGCFDYDLEYTIEVYATDVGLPAEEYSFSTRG